MTNTLRYPLRNISPATIADLQEKYPNASVSIELSTIPAEGGLSEDGFWNFIALLDWSQVGDDSAVIEPLVSALSAGPLRYIYDFKDILSQKLYLLDGSAYAAAFPDQDHDAAFGDVFLFARCCVVANGRACYQDVLEHPEKMPVSLYFSPILRVANEAWKRRFGTVMRYVSAYPIESFNNENAWKEIS